MASGRALLVILVKMVKKFSILSALIIVKISKDKKGAITKFF